MPDTEDLELLSKQWDDALNAEDWERALDISYNGYRIASGGKDHVEIMMFLCFLRTAVTRLFERNSKRKPIKKSEAYACSFCGKSSNDIKLIHGANDIAICSDCARVASEHFNSQR